MKTQLGDLLNFVGDRSISNYEWHIALVYQLNLGAAEEHHIQDTMTGNEVFQHLFRRGNEQAALLMGMYFNTRTGQLEEIEEPTLAVKVPEPPSTPVIITDRRAPQTPESYTWTVQKVIITTSAILITVVALSTAIFGHRGFSTEQERVIGTAISALSDIARSQVDSDKTSSEPVQEPSDETDSETAKDATQSP